LAETTVELPLPNQAGATVGLRQVHRQADDGTQIPVLTSRTDLPAAEVCWRLAARWRQENYFKYARAHFALDALDSYADTPDDPTRPVPNPAKAAVKTAVETARGSVHDAETTLSEAIDDDAGRARRPGSGATATVDPAAGTVLAAARDRLTAAADTSRATPGRLPLHQVRADARLLDEERKPALDQEKCGAPPSARTAPVAAVNTRWNSRRRHPTSSATELDGPRRSLVRLLCEDGDH
jgi:hypothetical protein